MKMKSRVKNTMKNCRNIMKSETKTVIQSFIMSSMICTTCQSCILAGRQNSKLITKKKRTTLTEFANLIRVTLIMLENKLSYKTQTGLITHKIKPTQIKPQFHHPLIKLIKMNKRKIRKNNL